VVLLVAVTSTAGIGYAVSVHQQQVEGGDADSCVLRADRCQRERAETEAMNARLMAEKRQLEAQHALALSRVEHEWESKVASVQEACQQQQDGTRIQVEQALADDLARIASGEALAGPVDPSHPYSPVFTDVSARLAEASAAAEASERKAAELAALNDSLTKDIDILADEKENRARRDKDLLDGLRAERAKRREFQFRDFQARAVWTLCSAEPHHHQEDCEHQVRNLTDKAHDRWTECLAFSDSAPELTHVDAGHTVPSYWARVWKADADEYWISLCDPHLPEAEGL